MKQEIICNKGKCDETGTIKSGINSLFDDKDLDDQIQKDMLKEVL